MGAPSPYGPTVVSVKAFLTEQEAIAYLEVVGACFQNDRKFLFIQKELDGRYHVYDGDQP